MVVEYSELQLVWPPPLFAAEASELLEAGMLDETEMGWLLDEAFAGDRAFRLYQEARRRTSFESIMHSIRSVGPVPAGQLQPAPSSPAPNPARDLAARLIRDAEHDALPRYRRRRYYRQRRGQPSEPVLGMPQLKRYFAATIGHLDHNGYFVEAFGDRCVDSSDDPDAEGQRQLSRLLGSSQTMWPLGRRGNATHVEQGWSDELFFSVIEALHDQAARPRIRAWHDHGQHPRLGVLVVPGHRRADRPTARRAEPNAMRRPGDRFAAATARAAGPALGDAVVRLTAGRIAQPRGGGGSRLHGRRTCCAAIPSARPNSAPGAPTPLGLQPLPAARASGDDHQLPHRARAAVGQGQHDESLALGNQA